jgi:lysozyme family protein
LSVNIASLIAANAKRWQAMHITPALGPTLDSVAGRLVAAKSRYEAVSAKTGVPWFVIAVIHERESSQSWRASLAQGDPYDRVSIHVPRGRGPFSSWEAAADDALVHCPPFAARWKDWSAGGALTLLEEYNGLGYAARGIPSPYVWASTDQYHHGKYIADGHFDPNAIDHQLGVAALISRMVLQDTTVKMGGHLGEALVSTTDPLAFINDQLTAGVAYVILPNEIAEAVEGRVSKLERDN